MGCISGMDAMPRVSKPKSTDSYSVRKFVTLIASVGKSDSAAPFPGQMSLTRTHIDSFSNQRPPYRLLSSQQPERQW